LQVNAVLTYQVSSRLKALGLTQKQACARLGLSQSDVSKLMHCKYTGFSSDWLLAFLVALDLDIDIVLRPRDHYRAAPRLRVQLRQPRRPHPAVRRRSGGKKPTSTSA
jgi:predicted XRE-type DNA-binding protein